MARNPNQKRIIIDLSGNWKDYQNECSDKYTFIGVVSRGTEAPGALARKNDNGMYVQLNNGIETELIQKKVIAALKANNHADY